MTGITAHRRLAALLAVGICASGLVRGAAFDPRLTWCTIESEHFSVHFPSQSLDADDTRLAGEYARAAEQAYALVAQSMHWHPREKVDIVLEDFYDYANGSSSPFPANTITAIPTFPTDWEINVDNWPRMLLIHEFTHTEDMDMVSGIMVPLRWLFGRFIVPNSFMPVWGLEGMAVFDETEFTDFGRGRSPYFDMQWRMASLENRFLSIDRAASYNLSRFPWGNAPYLYGAGFHRYLADRFGVEKLVEFHRWNSGAIPYFSGVSSRRVFGEPLTALWRDWSRTEKAKAENEAGRISASGLTRFRELTHDGESWSTPVFSADGRSIYCVRNNQSSLTAIVEIDTGTGRQKVILSEIANSDLSPSPDGARLVFSKREILGNYYDYDDLYELELGTRKVRLLTHGKRAREPSLASDERLAFVTNGMGRTAITVMDSSGRIRRFTDSLDATQYSSPSLSPDGTALLVQISRPGWGSDICLIDQKSGRQIALTSDRARDWHPRWSKDGRYAVFSSDRTGLFNIYAWDSREQMLYQVTNVLGGAFEPALSPDSRTLAFVNYSSRGYDIAVSDFNPADWREAKPFVDTLPVHTYLPESSFAIRQSEIHRYNPWPSLRPKSWVPWVVTDGTYWDFGFLTLGWDALAQHRFTLEAAYDTRDRFPSISASYINDQLFPTLSANIAADSQSQSLDLGSAFQWNRLLSRAGLTADYVFSRDSSRRLSGVSLGVSFSDALQYGYSISPAEGKAASMRLSAYPKALFSSGNLYKASASGQGFLSLPWRNHVLAGRAALGMAFGDSGLAHSLRLGGQSGSFKLRGFLPDSVVTRVLSFGIEYRFPLFRVDHGPGLFPVYLNTVSGALFTEAGAGWCTGAIPRAADFRTDGGAELGFQCVLGYLVPVSFQAGVARGFNRGDPFRFYVGANSSLLDELLDKRRDLRPLSVSRF